jgi:signal transduction histidine kinase
MKDFESDIAAIARIVAIPTILEVVCRTTGMGFAAVARVTEDRWIACGVLDNIAFGLQPGGELKIETTICSEIRGSQEAVIIDHASRDPKFHNHHTPILYGFESYISMPIVLPDGSFFGTLCAIDPRPARLNTPEIVGMFKLFAELIAFHLDAHYRIATSESDLTIERGTAELREQFIAVLGHDLRNPLASIGAASRMLLRIPVPAKGRDLIGLIQNSVARMSGLIDNVLDLTRGRLGGGLALRRCHAPLAPILEQVVAELRATWPDRVIETHFVDPGPLHCDQGRIGQLLSNLLANALTHGAQDGVVRVKTAIGLEFTLSVTNQGAPIPAEIAANLFKPFFRPSGPEPEGLGLGLYIASEIAKAHDGSLALTSSAEETCFTFSMPLR